MIVHLIRDFCPAQPILQAVFHLRWSNPLPNQPIIKGLWRYCNHCIQIRPLEIISSLLSRHQLMDLNASGDVLEVDGLIEMSLEIACFDNVGREEIPYVFFSLLLMLPFPAGLE